MMILKKLVCLVGWGLCNASLLFAQSTSFGIEGSVKGLSDGTCLQLVPVSHIDTSPVAEAVVKNGAFSFSGKINPPFAVRMVVKEGAGFLPLVLDSSVVMKIEGEIVKESHPTYTSYDFSKVVVSGSPLSDKYRSILKVRDALDSLYNANNMKYGPIREAFGKAYSRKNKVLMDSLRATAEYKASAEADSLFFVKVEHTYYDAVMQNKDSFWGPLTMISLFTYLGKEQADWYNALSQEAKDSYYGKLVKDEIWPPRQEGLKVADFSVKGQNGEDISLTELCQGKKYILIDFWASWCNPCRKEIPNLKNLYAKYADKGFQIISISIDKKKADWEKALQEEQLAWPNYLDTEGIASLYKVRFVPTMYLIDMNKTIIGENVRGEALAEKLAELFQSK